MTATRDAEGKKSSASLPNTAAWLPREQASNSLGVAFSIRCAAGEEHLRRVLDHERELAVDAFDSGVPFEAAVREEIARLVPRRYELTDGILVDRHGFTAGHADAIIFNSLWFTSVNAPMAAQPQRILVPIEGVYAVGEVKQQLTRKSLDDAMEKLVVCHRLHRPRTFANRLVENREADSCPHGLTNPLFSFIVAGGTSATDFQPLLGRFFDINRKLARLEIIRCLCVLGVGTVTWAFYDPLREGEIRPALFMRDDLFHPVVPAYANAEIASPFFSFMQMLHLHLFHSVLGPEDIATAYGLSVPQGISVPKQPEIALPPDEEWAAILSIPCTHRKDQAP